MHRPQHGVFHVKKKIKEEEKKKGFRLSQKL